MNEDISIGQFVLKQHDLKTQITTDLGVFSFKNLTPLEKSVCEGRITARLGNAPLNAVEPYIAELTKACVYLDFSKVDVPPGWESCNDFPGEDFIMSLWSKYNKWQKEISEKINKALEGITKS